VQNVTLQWDGQLASNLVYRVYDNGVITNLVATTTNLSVTISNVLAAPHRWTVTASNLWGESDPSVPLIVPGAPIPPTNLKPVSTTLLNVPIPGMIETTADLLNWEKRLRFAGSSNGVDVTQFVTPTQPMEFMRAKSFNVTVPPPLP